MQTRQTVLRSDCRPRWRALLLLWSAALALVTRPVHAVTPESPEVVALVDSALQYLETTEPDSYGQILGGRCLMGLAFLKSGRRDHPRVKEALDACQAALKEGLSEGAVDNYSNGLAIIFLCELDAGRYSGGITSFLELLSKRQKAHGGWGYLASDTGDTSQSQYGALSYWEAHRRGFKLPGDSVEGVADWLMRTQDPSGCWGYQGQLGTEGKLVPQTETGVSMLAAGLGIAYMCADLMDAVRTAEAAKSREDDWDKPSSLRVVDRTASSRAAAPKIKAQRIDLVKLMEAIERANEWMEKNYTIEAGNKTQYYLYGLERYQSFREALAGVWDDEPKWYNDGYELLKKDQRPDGSWSQYCGPACDTSFAVLFLLRSTKRSLQGGPGEGALLAGRGVPADLSRAKVRDGRLIVEQMRTKVDEFLTLIDDGDEGALDELARDPSLLVVEAVDESTSRRLEQLVRGGEPKVRLLAVRALARSGKLDYAPTLIHALSDPDRQVVIAARDGLEFIARRFDSFGPPDDYTSDERFAAIEAWKNWYAALRPGAAKLP